MKKDIKQRNMALLCTSSDFDVLRLGNVTPGYYLDNTP